MALYGAPVTAYGTLWPCCTGSLPSERMGQHIRLSIKTQNTLTHTNRSVAGLPKTRENGACILAGMQGRGHPAAPYGAP